MNERYKLGMSDIAYESIRYWVETFYIDIVSAEIGLAYNDFECIEDLEFIAEMEILYIPLDCWVEENDVS
jgi:hypothetical protein